MNIISRVLTKSSCHHRFLIAALATTALVSPLGTAHASDTVEIDSNALPSGEKVIGGEASFDRETPNVLVIKQSSDRLFIDWHEGFNIGEKSSTIFYQPDSKSIAVNRVVGKSIDPTQILGELHANGNVIILDQNGIIFGKSSIIDVGGIIASTGDINKSEFLDGKQITINNAVKGSISNSGTINVSDAGLAAFVAPNVRNDGLIVARKGTVLMGHAQVVTLDLYGDGLVEIKVGENIKETDIVNEGKIDTEGGRVLVTTAYVDDAVKELVNMTDIAKGNSFRVQNGKIIISEASPGPDPIPTPDPDPVPTPDPDPVPTPDPDPVPTPDPDPVPTPDPDPIPTPDLDPAPILAPEIILDPVVILTPVREAIRGNTLHSPARIQINNWIDITNLPNYFGSKEIDSLSYKISHSFTDSIFQKESLFSEVDSE